MVFDAGMVRAVGYSADIVAWERECGARALTKSRTGHAATRALRHWARLREKLA